MARLARSTVAGYPHQVTQQGNYGQPVFDEEADFRRYLTLLGECADRYSIEIWAYCLMRNHVHFICVPKTEGALAHGFNALHMRYSQYFNSKKGVTGHLWRGRFLSCILDDQSVFEEIRYIENNPVRAGLVERAEDYPWSSASCHVLGGPDSLLRCTPLMKSQISDWHYYLSGRADDRILKRTWQSLKTGRPAGDGEFMRKLEVIVGRRLEALPRGRPRKTGPNANLDRI